MNRLRLLCLFIAVSSSATGFSADIFVSDDASDPFTAGCTAKYTGDLCSDETETVFADACIDGTQLREYYNAAGAGQCQTTVSLPGVCTPTICAVTVDCDRWCKDVLGFPAGGTCVNAMVACYDEVGTGGKCQCIMASPTPSSTPSSTPTPTPTATSTATPTPSPTMTLFP